MNPLDPPPGLSLLYSVSRNMFVHLVFRKLNEAIYSAELTVHYRKLFFFTYFNVLLFQQTTESSSSYTTTASQVGLQSQTFDFVVAL